MSSPDIRCERVSLSDLRSFPGFKDVVSAYADEIRYEVAAAPDFGAYERMEAAGTLGIVAAVADGSCVGFASYVRYTLPHFGDALFASMESLYLLPAARQLGGGLKLVHALWDCAREDGCQGIYMGAPIGSKASKLFNRVAKPTNVLFWKAL